MAVTTMNLGSEEEYEALQQIAAGLGLYRKAGEGAGEVGSIPELLKRLGDQDAKVIAKVLSPLFVSNLPEGEQRRIRVTNLSQKQGRTLTEIARLTGQFQTRGVGTGRTGNRSTLLRQMTQTPDAVIAALSSLDIDWVEGIEYQGETYRTYQDLADKLGVSRQWAYQLVNGE